MVWGSSFILIKKALIAFEPLEVASLRISISALAFTPFFFRHRTRVSALDWRALVIVGLCGSGIPAFCYAMAQTQISSITTGILNSLTPLFTLLIGVWFFSVTSHWLKYIGVIIGLLGAIFLIYFNYTASLQIDMIYALLIVVGTICYAISGNVVKQYLNKIDSFTISVLSLSLLGLPALVILLRTDVLIKLSNHSEAWFSLGAVAILALFGTVLASIVYFRLVQITSALFASSVSYLIPMVAVILGFMDGEPVLAIQVAGMALIISGVYLTRR